MGNALADYRGDLDNLLATAVDSSTWTTAIKDEALRLGLGEINSQLVYEASFTVVTAGYEQDLSGISAINNVLALAYPWVDGSVFGGHLAEWRFMGVNKVYFANVQPAVDEVIRVRYTKLHVIEDLDSAVATTVPDRDRLLLGLWAAGFGCDLRVRQISENPALPREAVNVLRMAGARFRGRATEMLSHVPPLGRLRWGGVGLE